MTDLSASSTGTSRRVAVMDHDPAETGKWLDAFATVSRAESQERASLSAALNSTACERGGLFCQ